MKPQNYIPCYRYPTETILVDDNKNFLKTLQFALGKQYKCKPFEDPEKALKYISESPGRVKTAISKYITEGEDLADLKKSVIVNMKGIHKAVYNKDRFKEIAVVVIDYAMPTMNGLEVCKRIRKLTKNPIKIIMLTGEAGLDLAVEAFNDGLIDKFILKGTDKYVDEVVAAISTLQEKYFFDLSEPIRRSLQSSAQKLFEKQVFIDVFNKIINENNIKEFYILDDSFSVLFIDDKGENPICLIIRTENDMQVQYELASDDKTVPPEIIEAIKNRKKFAYFKDEKGISQDAKYWIFQDAKPLNKHYYYAVVKGKDSYPLNREKLLTYQSYLKAK